jgi:formylglycine-generating enzyme required for sulfatase activity
MGKSSRPYTAWVSRKTGKTYRLLSEDSKGEYRKRTVPVDSFEPNPWGLYRSAALVRGN